MSDKPESIDTSSQDTNFDVIYFVFVFIAVVLTLLFINLVGNRWAYYDIGLNAFTRSWELLFCGAPISFLGLLSAIAFTRYIASHEKLSRRNFLLVGIACMVVIFVLMFLLDVWRLRDYPNPFNRGLLDFLNYYFEQWF